MTATNSPSAIGTAIRQLRTSAGLTLADVATLAGISVSYLSRVENGLVSPTPQWVHIVTSAIGDRLIGTTSAAA